MKIPCDGCGSPKLCERFSCAADPETCPATGGLHDYFLHSFATGVWICKHCDHKREPESDHNCKHCSGNGGWEQLNNIWDDRDRSWIDCPRCLGTGIDPTATIPLHVREPKPEVDLTQRRTFWRVIAGLWVAGGAMLYSLYRYLFKKGDSNGKHDRS